jgi:glucan phosphoethanolaminetransferase (alkaline phosphatase superfamily)
MKFDKLYPIKIWLASIVFFGPIVMSLGSLLENRDYLNNPDNVGVIFLFVLFGLVLSVPTFAIMFLTFIFAVRHFQSAIAIRLICLIVSVCGVVITFLLLKGSMAPKLTLVYSISVAMSSCVFRLYKKQNVGSVGEL